jgi:hypothetical protein
MELDALVTATWRRTACQCGLGFFVFVQVGENDGPLDSNLRGAANFYGAG